MKNGLDLKFEFMCDCGKYLEHSVTFPDGNRIRYQCRCEHCLRTWDVGVSINFLCQETGKAKLVD